MLRAEILEGRDAESAHAYLLGHPLATWCHHPAWLAVMRETYGKKTYVLTARGEDGSLRGACPVAELRSPLFGRQWVALPYLDYGGPLADDAEAETALVAGLLRNSADRGCRLEIRSAHALDSQPRPANAKVAMILGLDGTEESYWKALDARVRNQVRKAEKSGVTVRFGGAGELDAFYGVFCENMHALGSPVHSRRLFSSALVHVPGVEIGTAWRQGRCIGGLLRLRFRETLAIPWASTLASERVYCPNHALYYDSIRAAFREGLRRVDFGRSSEGEGTYRFKTQWEAAPAPLPWYQFGPEGLPAPSVAHVQSGKLQAAAWGWKRLPLSWANRLGPGLRGAIAA